MRSFRPRRPSPALVVAVIALLAALGGTAYAGFKVPKNSVGSKQLKNNAVTTKKIKNGAVTAGKINTSGLTVPNALHANAADNATNATNATNIAAPEGIHIIGASGQPAFQNGCTDLGGALQPVGFYKDKEGIVHLQGAFTCSSAVVAFQLPPGYRPANGTELIASSACGITPGVCELPIVGPGVVAGDDGAVVDTASTGYDTTGVSFRPGA